MKRILIVIVVLAGVGGLIALLSFHPKATTSAVAKPKSSVVAQASASPKASASASPASGSSSSSGKYKDGSYTGTAANTIYGTVQVQAVVSSGKISTINFVQMPSGGESSDVTSMAEPKLQQEAVSAQSAQVDTVSGATQTSEGFEQSLSSALSQAQA